MLQSALSLLPPTRQQLLTEIRRRTEARAEELALAVGITVGGVRQQLTALYGDGLVVYREAADGPGRPKHYYRLTQTAEALFPDQARELLANLAGYLEANAPAALDQFLERYAADTKRRLHGALDATVTPDERLAELLAWAARQGFMPELEAAEDGTAYLNLFHCPLLQLARGTPRVCDLGRRLLETVCGTAVRRAAWRRQGDPVCAYRFAIPASPPVS